jgi:hypothetical protein
MKAVEHEKQERNKRGSDARGREGAHEKKHVSLEDIVDAAGRDSFPASDPPCWSPINLGPPGKAGPAGRALFRDVVQHIHDDVLLLSEAIGERNDRSPRALQNLVRAAAAIEDRFRDAGLPVRRRRVNETAWNIEAVLRGNGSAAETVVVGAHYDTPRGSPGADDNASGVAVLLALAHSLRWRRLDRTVRLVAFAAEEPPHLGTEWMGSARYLEDLRREGPTVTSMMSLEGIGRFVPESHPWPFRLVNVLRSELALVGERRARDILERAKAAFDAADEDLSVAVVTHPLLFATVRAQSHYAFARQGIPAFMVTDTTPLRSIDYHRSTDTADRLDFERLGSISIAIEHIVADLTRADRVTA